MNRKLMTSGNVRRCVQFIPFLPIYSKFPVSLFFNIFFNLPNIFFSELCNCFLKFQIVTYIYIIRWKSNFIKFVYSLNWQIIAFIKSLQGSIHSVFLLFKSLQKCQFILTSLVRGDCYFNFEQKMIKFNTLKKNMLSS